ncbi:putative protein kinase domain containing protein [Botrytis fragariae]|uniref:Protein kinase domain-containing protein n=1 Tax=Botrytis fragariae TaxID=1964551 RepID=A0A8H6AQL9_9HELO|nr:putative protein kinase domain containing protein [Botrytis fragariae]KAF5872153.1 putative protein kinase domain containing protein [Botrytis fragariae]
MVIENQAMDCQNASTDTSPIEEKAYTPIKRQDLSYTPATSAPSLTTNTDANQLSLNVGGLNSASKPQPLREQLDAAAEDRLNYIEVRLSLPSSKVFFLKSHSTKSIELLELLVKAFLEVSRKQNGYGFGGKTMSNMIIEKGYIEETRMKIYFKEVLLGLEYLKSKNILHRDIKPGNMILGRGSGGRIMIADFGLADNLIGGKRNKMTSRKGTLVCYLPFDCAELAGDDEKKKKNTILMIKNDKLFLDIERGPLGQPIGQK